MKQLTIRGVADELHREIRIRADQHTFRPSVSTIHETLRP